MPSTYQDPGCSALRNIYRVPLWFPAANAVLDLSTSSDRLISGTLGGLRCGGAGQLFSCDPQGKHAWQWKTTKKISIWVSLPCYFSLIAGRYKWVTRGYEWVMGGHGLCPSFAHGLRVHPLCIGFVWVSPNLALAWCLTIPSVFEHCSLITCRLVGGFKQFLCSIYQ